MRLRGSRARAEGNSKAFVVSTFFHSTVFGRGLKFGAWDLDTSVGDHPNSILLPEEMQERLREVVLIFKYT